MNAIILNLKTFLLMRQHQIPCGLLFGYRPTKQIRQFRTPPSSNDLPMGAGENSHMDVTAAALIPAEHHWFPAVPAVGANSCVNYIHYVQGSSTHYCPHTTVAGVTTNRVPLHLPPSPKTNEFWYMHLNRTCNFRRSYVALVNCCLCCSCRCCNCRSCRKRCRLDCAFPLDMTYLWCDLVDCRHGGQELAGTCSHTLPKFICRVTSSRKYSTDYVHPNKTWNLWWLPH